MDAGFQISGQVSRFSAQSHYAEIRVELFLTVKQEKTEDHDLLDFSFKEPPMNDNPVISMIGGLEVEVDHPKNKLLLQFG